MLIRHNLAWGKATKFSISALAIAIALGLVMTPSLSSFALAEGHEDGDTTHSGGPKGPGGHSGGDDHTSSDHETDTEDDACGMSSACCGAVTCALDSPDGSSSPPPGASTCS